MSLSKYAFAALLLPLTALQAQAITVVNGGFEDPKTNTNVYSVPANPMPGWTVAAGNVEIIRLPTWAPSEGEQSLDLNGVLPGTIQQTVSGFTIGSDYELLFDMGGNFFSGLPSTTAVVSVGQTTETFGYTPVPGDTASNFTWEEKSLTFTAEAESLLLSFSDASGGRAAGAALDNIRIVDLGGMTPIPLPAGGLLLLTGLVALGFKRRS
ncbi:MULTISPECIES: DUF642 domain-containing protein [unclassified Dinoroseobacter]|uniref:DUF642 domain-containing protein n=1 Tax=unclassified Dinoroseobacter TaxID=2620028 RepID=UPI003C7B5A08